MMSMICVATIWLSATDQLKLYIHPRYELFTVLMAVLGLIVSFGGILTLTEQAGSLLRQLKTVSVLGMIAGFILIPAPRLLGAATASQRAINSGNVRSGSNEERLLKERGDHTRFTVKDWAVVLRESSDLAVHAQKMVRLTGFITPATEDSFYVTRFVIACCAVDAQPVGVLVFYPDWRRKFAVDQWVEISGKFAIRESNKLAVVPDHIQTITKPEDPYIY